MTRVIFSPNNEAAPDAPIIFGEAGGQAIRIIGGQNKTIITNSPKTITLAQAKEMGLISPRKIHQLNQSKVSAENFDCYSFLFCIDVVCSCFISPRLRCYNTRIQI